jgi:uncharacterized membrane protein
MSSGWDCDMPFITPRWRLLAALALLIVTLVLVTLGF